jgi:predicted RNA polymerase sigma factor
MLRQEAYSFLVPLDTVAQRRDAAQKTEVHMNALHQEVQDVMNHVFQRYPALCGFSVQDDLSFTHVACHPALAGDEAVALIEEISETLRELIEERPEAANVLRGRTLARRFH